MDTAEKKGEPAPWCQIEKQQIEINIQNSKEPDRFKRIIAMNYDNR